MNILECFWQQITWSGDAGQQQCFKKLFESCKVHLLLKFSTFQYSKIPLYWSLHSSWCCNQLALANEIWCQRLPREITNASLLFVLCRAQKREGKFSTIVCGSVHVAQKTLVVWYKKFSNLVWSKKFFFYFNFLVFHLLSYYVIVLRSQYLSSCQSIDEEARSHIRKL